MFPTIFARIDHEATTVFIVCGVVLCLFLVAGVRDIMQNQGRD